MNFTFLPFKKPFSSECLLLTLMILEDWVLINISGKDVEKYLQSQVTADVLQIKKNQHLFVAHCNPQGKVWSNLLLFRDGEGFSFIERRSVQNMQLNEMRKYAVFSKVTFTHNDNYILLGVAGSQARYELQNLFSELPSSAKPLVHIDKYSILWFKHPIERFLLIIDENIFRLIIKAFHKKSHFSNSKQWLSFHIEAGVPVIDLPNSGRFIPQAINLQVFGGINFKKGCYIGQEIVTRTEFRGTNKRVLRYLSGTANRVPNIGEDLELKINEKWQRNGIVLAAVHLNDGRLLVQAVINSALELNSVFRIQNDETSILKIKSLPYQLKFS